MLRSKLRRERPGTVSRCPASRARSVAIAAVLAGLCVASAAEVASGLDPQNVIGPLGLERVSVSQDAWRLGLGVRTSGRWDPAQLTDRPRRTADGPQSYVCVDLRQLERLRRACVGRGEGRPAHLTWMKVGERGGIGPPRRLKQARLERGNRRSLRASVPFRALGLRPGRAMWRWRTSWGRGACAPGPEPDRGDLPAANGRAAGRRCIDLAPRSGFAPIRLRQPRQVGCTRASSRVYRAGSRGRRQVALTFDDGPGPYTSAVLRALARHNAKATFFVLGQESAGRGGLLRRMLREGHEIGNHSTSHGAAPSRSDLARTNAIIRGATGFSPCVFRPPYGIATGATVSGAWSLGMSTILWDVDPSDWRNPGAGAIASHAIRATRPGSIVLMHDGGGNRSRTVAALPSILRQLKSRGYRFVTVTRLLGQRVRWR